MLFGTLFATVLFLNFAINKCEPELLQNNDKSDNASEICIKIKEPNNTLMQIQLETMRAEQLRQGAVLDELMQKLKQLTSLEPKQFASSCAEAVAQTRQSGVYQILIPGFSVHPFLVSCEEDLQFGGWTNILRRYDGSLDFYLYWNDFKNGFGNINGEFFIGLDKLHAMTKDKNQELLIVMEDAKGQQKFAKYNKFAIGSETEFYKLHTLGDFTGDAGDSLTSHINQKFSTRDRDNDPNAANCAELYTGGWWYANCHQSNLMGKYNDNRFGKGMDWQAFAGYESSLKSVQMMIRTKRQ